MSEQTYQYRGYFIRFVANLFELLKKFIFLIKDVGRQTSCRVCKPDEQTNFHQTVNAKKPRCEHT